MSLDKPILCLGSLVADLVARPLRALPAAGRQSVVDEIELFPGGGAANTALALAKFGLPVHLVGKTGCDALGDFLLQALAAAGVNTEGVQRDPQAHTSTSIVLVDQDGERRFIHAVGANARLTAQDVDLALLESAGILMITASLVLPGLDGGPAAALLARARSSGALTCLDVTWDESGRWMEVLAPCLPQLDYFIPNLEEARALSGLSAPEEAARWLLERGVKTMVVKLGAEGCLVLSGEGERLRLPAYQAECIDATGAGDAFAAGLLAGIWLGWPLEQAARLANAAGALCVTRLGAAGGLRSLEETVRFMETAEVKTG